MAQTIAPRWPTEADAEPLAALGRAAWRHAYAGVIPGPTLERMLARRGAGFWRRALAGGAGQVLVLDLPPLALPPLALPPPGWATAAPTGPAGYALYGAARARGPGLGEVYELYVRPEAQGTGIGRQLFLAARAGLAARGRPRTVVWALEGNALALRFYRALGGAEIGRGTIGVGGRRLGSVGFFWP